MTPRKIFAVDTQFKQLQKRSLKKKKKKKKTSGFSGIRTRDLCDTGAVLYQLSYEAITVGSRSTPSGSIMPPRVIQHYSDWVCTAVMSNIERNIVVNKKDLKQTCTCTTLSVPRNKLFSWFCAVSKTKFFAFPQPRLCSEHALKFILGIFQLHIKEILHMKKDLVCKCTWLYCMTCSGCRTHINWQQLFLNWRFYSSCLCCWRHSQNLSSKTPYPL